MPSTRRHSYDLNFKLKIIAEAETVNNNREIAREYGISESMVRKWRNQQHVLFSGDRIVFYIYRSCSKQHHDSAKGERTQLRSRVQGVSRVVYEMETSACYFHEK